MLEPSTTAEAPVDNLETGGAAVYDGLKADHGEDGDRSLAANRWPHEETMALIKIRSDMDVAFRDTNLKAPLWEQVSRKLAELGYDRSGKKCKEKFENIYKYHRRTKEGRYGKSNGNKTYRFFEQLEFLEGHHSLTPPQSMTAPTANNNNNNDDDDVIIRDAVPCSVHLAEQEHDHELSGSTCSDLGKGFKKRKLTQFLDGLMREVTEKQESLQRKFMEVLDKCERDRMAREEAWKREELARIKRERELLAQERSIAAAKDEAVLAFLRKFAESEGAVQLLEKIQVQNNKDKIQNVSVDGDTEKEECANGNGNGNGNVVNVGNFVHMSSSRWPKDEVEALIRLRTQLDVQTQNGSKGPLWEEISLAMKGIGYDRSAKRCKEKWENINKYFKRMKEKNKRKPMDSKTCPYYHQLEALYSKKPKKVDQSGENNNNSNNNNSELKPEELLMHIMESQNDKQQTETQSSSEDAERENTDQNQGDNEDQSGGYHNHNQMADNNSSPSSTAIITS